MNPGEFHHIHPAASVEPPADDPERSSACRGGELAAFEAIVRAHQGAVWAMALSATRDPTLSQDVAQETFLVAWRRLGDLRDPRKLRSWLCGIARNLGHSAVRKAHREAPAPHDDAARVERGRADDPEQIALSRERAAVLDEALDALPEAYREALLLYYRDEQSIRSVATALDISEDAARQRLTRGRKKLKDEVFDRLERALSRARPGAAFTAAVMAAIGHAGAADAAGAASAGETSATTTVAAGASATAGAWTGWPVYAAGAVLLAGLLAAMVAVRTSTPATIDAGDSPDTPHAAAAWDRRAPALASAASPESLDSELTPEAPLMILEIVDALGGPIPGAELVASDGTIRGTADEHGILRLRGGRADRTRGTLRAHGYASRAVFPGNYGHLRLAMAPEAEISGVVLDDASGIPADGVVVTAGEERVETDVAGRFTIGRLAPGRYQPRAATTGRVAEHDQVIDLGMHERVSGVVLRLRPSHVIRGVVRGGGSRLPGPLAVTLRRGWTLFAHDIPVAPDGSFTIPQVAPGEYTVQASAPGAALDPFGGAPVMVTDADVMGIVVDLRTLHPVPIEVITTEGEHVSGVRVAATPPNALRPRSLQCVTDDEGRCRLLAPAGPLQQLGPVLPGVAARDITLPLPRRHGVVRFVVPALGRIAGRLLDATGRPLPHHLVALRAGDELVDSPLTDAGGRFLFDRLPPGTYWLGVGPHRGLDLSGMRKIGEPLEERELHLQPGEALDDLTLSTAITTGDVVGRVVDDGGAPLSGALVSYRASTILHPWFPTSPFELTETDASGSFRLADLPRTGSYQLYVQHPSGLYAWIRDVEAGGQPLEVTPHVPAELVVVIPPHLVDEVDEIVVQQGDQEPMRRSPLFRDGSRFFPVRPGEHVVELRSEDEILATTRITVEPGEVRELLLPAP